MLRPPVEERPGALEKRFPRWQPRTLDQMLDAAAEEFPDRAFVVIDEGTYTYRDVRGWSVRIARGLVSAGVGTGDHVAVVLANYPEYVALKYAIARCGGRADQFYIRNHPRGRVLHRAHAGRCTRFYGCHALQGWAGRRRLGRLPRRARTSSFTNKTGRSRCLNPVKRLSSAAPLYPPGFIGSRGPRARLSSASGAARAPGIPSESAPAPRKQRSPPSPRPGCGPPRGTGRLPSGNVTRIGSRGFPRGHPGVWALGSGSPHVL